MTKRTILLCLGLLLAGISTSTVLADDSELLQLLEVVEATQPTPASNTPAFGVFYAAQHITEWPPLPGNVLQLPFWNLGDGVLILDDRTVDYNALAAAATDDEDTQGLGGRGGRMAMTRINNDAAYSGPPVYLTNLMAAPSGSGMAVSFDVLGGTNNFTPWDVWRLADLTNSITNGTWLGIAYSGMTCSFSNQPADTAYYALARPQLTFTVGWGMSDTGQIDVPFGLTNSMAVAAGGAHSLALLNNGTLRAWGLNASGQATIPASLTNGVTMVSAGFQFTTAISNSTVSAWGYDVHSLGYTMTEVPAGLTNATVIASEADHTLALRSDGTVVAWGYDALGETNVPSGLSNVVAVAAGWRHSLVAKADGTVTAWGDNTYGQCNIPSGLSNVLDVAAGPYHSMALTSTGTVVAWGVNAHGEASVPAGLSNVVAIAAGGNPIISPSSAFSLALKQDGTVVAWGDGPALNSVQGLSNVIALAAGADFALAVRTGPPTPVITQVPTDQYHLVGDTATFTSRGAGLYSLAYQWQTNGVNLTGATNATLTLTNVQAAQAGAYNVLVTSEYGSILSSNATLYLVGSPTIVSETTPANQTVVYTTNVTLSVTAQAVGQFNGYPIGYQWNFNGTPISEATNASYAFTALSAGTYSVVVSNAVGSTNAAWSFTLNYSGTYIDTNTLAYHLSTNAVAHTNGISDIFDDTIALAGWGYAQYFQTNLDYLTNSTWSTNFWLKGVQGLSATSIGASNGLGGQGLITMVSPRHFLFAQHVSGTTTNQLNAFLDTNNVVYWRSVSQRQDVIGDISVGILNADLPSSVGFLKILPPDFVTYLPTNNTFFIQGLGMNQDMRIFGEPMTLGGAPPDEVDWDSTQSVPFGVSTNWNVAIRLGDSSAPGRLLVGNTTVRVLDGVNAGMSSVYRPLVPVRGCERLEVFMRFPPSMLFAKLKKCMLENLFSPNSRI